MPTICRTPQHLLGGSIESAAETGKGRRMKRGKRRWQSDDRHSINGFEGVKWRFIPPLFSVYWKMTLQEFYCVPLIVPGRKGLNAK